MLKTNAPTKFTVPFAASGTKNTIPVAASPTTGLASYTTGFTAVNMEPIASGGVPPAGQDFNGIHFDATNAMLWKQSGFQYAFDSAWASNANIGGYPAQALLARADGKGLWLNLTDNNTTNPDATSPSGWVAVRANMGTSIIAVSGATTTPDPSVLGVPVLVITGSLTANTGLVLPLTAGASWIIENNTTGAFTLTVQGATGTGVSVATGNPSQVYTDGTNFYATTANVSGLYLPINGNAVSASKLATARTISATGAISWSVSFDGSANVTAAASLGSGAVALSNMANFQANSLMGNPTGAATTPSAITLQNGLTFSGTNLGLGNITPTTVSASGNITANNAFISAISSVILAPTGAGTIYLRPNGASATGGQVTITANGQISANTASAAPALVLTTTGSNTSLVINDATAGGILLNMGGGATPSKFLRVNGGSFQIINNAYSATIFNLSDSGNIVAGGTITPGSDERIKINIVPITGALDIIRTALVGVEYDRIDQDGTHDAGFIAQHVKERLPHLVPITETNGFTDFHSMNYNGAVAYLSAAIVELHDIVKHQQPMIEASATKVE